MKTYIPCTDERMCPGCYTGTGCTNKPDLPDESGPMCEFCESSGVSREKCPIHPPGTGMYGETPKVQIPDCGLAGLSICRQGEYSVWIQDEATGEGSEFHDEIFYPFLREFFDKHF